MAGRRKKTLPMGRPNEEKIREDVAGSSRSPGRSAGALGRPADYLLPYYLMAAFHLAGRRGVEWRGCGGKGGRSAERKN